MASVENQDFYQAVIAAFSLVAYADGQVHMSEMSKLVTTLKAEGLFKNVDPQQLQDDVFALVKELNRDFEKKGLPAFLEKIAKVKGNPRERDFIIKMSRLIVIADGDVEESEEKVLADIHRVLGVSE